MNMFNSITIPGLAGIQSALAADKLSKADADRRFLKVAGLLMLACMLAMPQLAMAGPWDTVADNVLGIFTGGLTRTIAIISIIACGIAAMFGKLSWDWAIKIVVGILLIFGGAAIVDYVIAAAEA
jgi:type IV secretory pathway VirB2 component (pilin)